MVADRSRTYFLFTFSRRHGSYETRLRVLSLSQNTICMDEKFVGIWILIPIIMLYSVQPQSTDNIISDCMWFVFLFFIFVGMSAYAWKTITFVHFADKIYRIITFYWFFPFFVCWLTLFLSHKWSTMKGRIHFYDSKVLQSTDKPDWTSVMPNHWTISCLLWMKNTRGIGQAIP